MIKQTKPIDASLIDFLMKETPFDTRLYNSQYYSDLRSMSMDELCALFWNAMQVLEDLPLGDIAFHRFHTESEKFRRFINIRYTHQPEAYKEHNIAIYYPLLTRNVGNTPRVLSELLDTYSEDCFSYIIDKSFLVVIPYPTQSKSPQFLEFMETAKQLGISDGPTVTDSTLWLYPHTQKVQNEQA